MKTGHQPLATTFKHMIYLVVAQLILSWVTTLSTNARTLTACDEPNAQALILGWLFARVVAKNRPAYCGHVDGEIKNYSNGIKTGTTHNGALCSLLAVVVDNRGSTWCC
ncbi:hypothetical protein BDC45DRAFT_532702 [Circinella umbellata]|nr:hypothetical protein BDC45DRAFT_532702 [Circinella umbellata]